MAAQAASEQEMSTAPKTAVGETQAAPLAEDESQEKQIKKVDKLPKEMKSPIKPKPIP